MAFCHVVHVRHVQSRVYVCRDFSSQGIDDDPAGGRWFDVARADRCGRVDDDDGQSLFLDQFPDGLLGQVFRTLVVADHVFQGDRRGFIGRTAVAVDAQSCHAAGIDHSADTRVRGLPEQVPGAVNVGPVHACRVGYPQAIVGGDVEQVVATADCLLQRGGVGEVAFNQGDVQLFQVAPVTAGPDQGLHFMALLQQFPYQRRADEAVGAGNQRGHPRLCLR